jgi:hypothetical protein
MLNSQNLNAVNHTQAGQLGLVVVRNDSAHRQDPAPRSFGKRPAGSTSTAKPRAEVTTLVAGGCCAGSVRRRWPAGGRPQSYPIASEAVVGPTAALWASLVVSRAMSN